METAAFRGQRPLDTSLAGALPLIIPLALLAIPTLATFASETWTREAGAHGPIVLATGLWLLWRLHPEFQQHGTNGRLWLTLTLLVPSLAFYVLGRALDFITFEAAGLYGVVLAMFHAKLGARIMIKHWFPFLYLGFLVPPPNYLLASLTAPLKLFVSFAATEGLRFFDFPVAQSGVTIMIAQYQLLVEDACSGLNSIMGLTAIGLFYIYLLRNASVAYSFFLACLVIPIAVAVNIVRVVILVLLTYFYGDAVAQGISHFAAGAFLFVTSVLMVFAIDKFLIYVGARIGRPA